MIFFYLKEPFGEFLAKKRLEGKIIGFVPTMGALHQGHISLINAAKQSCDLVVCSIFVNPTQFNNLQDLEKYPRTLDSDSKMLERAGCDVLFAPEISEMYTAKELELKSLGKEDKSWMEGKNVSFGMLDKIMEGAQRPGHFNGVAQVVSKLFRIVQPHKAFFGQKDFQQLAIIKSMVNQSLISVEIIPCPILREPDGLAMSSRNVRLTPEQRKIAPFISQVLFKVKDLKESNSPAQLKEFVREQFDKQAEMKLAYFEIVDGTTLASVSDFNQHKEVVACIAVEIGSLRLIDNVVLK